MTLSRHRFEKSPFSPVHTGNGAFPLFKLFSKVSVFIGVFGRFSVGDRRKRIKTYAFSNVNALVWMEPKNHTGASQVTASLVAVNVTSGQTHTAVL